MSKKKDKKPKIVELSVDNKGVINDPRDVELAPGDIGVANVEELRISANSAYAFFRIGGRVVVVGFDSNTDEDEPVDLTGNGYDKSMLGAWCELTGVRRKDIPDYVKAIDAQSSIASARKLLEDAGYTVAEPIA
jgi:hypothetical protein